MSPEPRVDVRQEQQVLVLTIDNPKQRNALALEMYPAMQAALAKAAADRTIQSVVITGAQGHFCAGGNLHRLKANRQGPKALQEASIDALHRLIDAVNDCPKPVIAAVEGAAAGAGYSLALACDLLVAARNAQFVMAYVKVGLSPDGGGSWQLLHILPKQIALEQLLTGAALAAPRLAELGVVNQLTEPGAALAGALALAARFDALSPEAVKAAKRLAQGARLYTRQAQMEREKSSFVECLYGWQAGEAIDAFLTKRAPRFDDPDR